jgi:S1-C subfamily serine protease
MQLASLKLSPGHHTIRVVMAGYSEWSRELTVQPGWEAHLAAVLQKNEPADEIQTARFATADSAKESVAAPASTNSTQESVGWIGVHAQNKGDVAVVTSVTADSPGAKAGIQVGDIILALDGRLIKGKHFETAVAALKPGSQISINYARGSAAHEVQITVGSSNR